MEFWTSLIKTYWPTISASALTILSAVGTTIDLIPATAITKTASIVGVISVIYLIQLHRRSIAKQDIEIKLLQLKYDQQVLGRREEDLK